MKKMIIFLSVIAIPLGLMYFFLGILVIQPIGALPQGATVIYYRANTNMNFIESPDSLVIKAGIPLSLFARGMSLIAVTPVVAKEKIIALPYSETLYLMSTNGQKFDR